MFIRIPETMQNPQPQQLNVDVKARANGLQGFHRDTLPKTMISKRPSGSANTQNTSSAKMGLFQSPIFLQTHSPASHYLLSNNSECGGNLQQEQMKVREALSSGFQVVNDNPSLQTVKVLNMKSLEISSRNSLQGNGDAHSSAGVQKFQSKLDEYNQRFRTRKKNNMGGALSLLLDAIQLLEDEDQLKEGKEKAKGLLGSPGLESHQCRVNDDSKAAKKMTPNQVSHIGDCKNDPVNISKGSDTGHGAKPEVQAKRRRRQTLPSKYSDSVLLPWN